MYNQANNFPGKIWAGRYEGDALGCNNFPSLISTSRIDDNKWHNVIFQRKWNGLLELYIDAGIEGNVADNTICSLQNPRNLLIGSRAKSNPFRRAFKGSIDNIRIYNRALNQAEIDAINNKIASSANEPEGGQGVIVYPNPVTGYEINLSNAGDVEIESLSLYDATGRFVRDIRGNKVEGIPDGVYYLKIVFRDFTQIFKKVVISG